MTNSQTRSGRWTGLSILAVIVGFAVWWPLGLSALAYILWAGPIDGLADDAWSRIRTVNFWSPAPKKTGNAAFDAYKAETLKRLEAEQAAFADYLVKLREARDREEFERFMTERKTQA